MKSLARKLKAQTTKAENTKSPIVQARRMVAASTKLMSALFSLQNALTAANTHVADYGQVRRLRSVMATDGVSRSLMNFVNHDGVASKFISGLPAVESLDMIALTPDDRRCQRALEGLDAALETEQTVTSQDVSEVVSRTIGALKALSEKLDPYESRAEALADAISGVEISDELLGNTSLVALSADACKSVMEILITVASSTSTAPDFSDMTAEKAAELETELAAVVESMCAFTGLQMDDMTVTIDPSLIADENKAVEGTLKSLGYTPATTEALLRQLGTLIDALENTADQCEAIEKGFLTAITGELTKPEAAPADPAPAEPAPAEPAPAEPTEPTEPTAPATEADTGGETPAATDEGGASTEEPVVHDYILAAKLAFSYATVLMATIDSCATMISDVVGVGDSIAELTGTTVTEDTEEGEAAEPAPAPVEPAPEPTEPAPAEPPADPDEPAAQAEPATQTEPSEPAPEPEPAPVADNDAPPAEEPVAEVAPATSEEPVAEPDPWLSKYLNRDAG